MIFGVTILSSTLLLESNLVCFLALLKFVTIIISLNYNLLNKLQYKVVLCTR